MVLPMWLKKFSLCDRGVLFFCFAIARCCTHWRVVWFTARQACSKHTIHTLTNNAITCCEPLARRRYISKPPPSNTRSFTENESKTDLNLSGLRIVKRLAGKTCNVRGYAAESYYARLIERRYVHAVAEIHIDIHTSKLSGCVAMFVLMRSHHFHSLFSVTKCTLLLRSNVIYLVWMAYVRCTDESAYEDRPISLRNIRSSRNDHYHALWFVYFDWSICLYRI